MLSASGKLEQQLTERLKDYTSIKFIEVSIFEFSSAAKALFTINKIKTAGTMKFKVNEAEYVADVLLYSDILKQLRKEYSEYQFTIEWIR